MSESMSPEKLRLIAAEMVSDDINGWPNDIVDAASAWEADLKTLELERQVSDKRGRLAIERAARIEALEKQVRLDYRALKLVAMDSSPAKRLAFCEENNLMPQKGSDGKYPPCACTDDYWRAAIVGTAIDPRRSAVDLAALAAEEET